MACTGRQVAEGKREIEARLVSLGWTADQEERESLVEMGNLE